MTHTNRWEAGTAVQCGRVFPRTSTKELRQCRECLSCFACERPICCLSGLGLRAGLCDAMTAWLSAVVYLYAVILAADVSALATPTPTPTPTRTHMPSDGGVA